MRGWSFPLGRWMGVELRIHTFFILLLGICMAYTESVHLTMFRGVGLWLVLLGAVAVREVARMLVAAYHGLQLRNILLAKPYCVLRKHLAVVLHFLLVQVATAQSQSDHWPSRNDIMSYMISRTAARFCWLY